MKMKQKMKKMNSRFAEDRKDKEAEDEQPAAVTQKKVTLAKMKLKVDLIVWGSPAVTTAEATLSFSCGEQLFVCWCHVCASEQSWLGLVLAESVYA